MQIGDKTAQVSASLDGVWTGNSPVNAFRGETGQSQHLGTKMMGSFGDVGTNWRCKQGVANTRKGPAKPLFSDSNPLRASI
jgi:hypothetical protein